MRGGALKKKFFVKKNMLGRRPRTLTKTVSLPQLTPLSERSSINTTPK